MDLPRENSERLTHDASPESRWCDRRREGPGLSAHQDISEPCQQPTSAYWRRNVQSGVGAGAGRQAGYVSAPYWHDLGFAPSPSDRPGTRRGGADRTLRGVRCPCALLFARVPSDRGQDEARASGVCRWLEIRHFSTALNLIGPVTCEANLGDDFLTVNYQDSTLGRDSN